AEIDLGLSGRIFIVTGSLKPNFHRFKLDGFSFLLVGILCVQLTALRAHREAVQLIVQSTARYLIIIAIEIYFPVCSAGKCRATNESAGKDTHRHPECKITQPR